MLDIYRFEVNIHQYSMTLRGIIVLVYSIQFIYLFFLFHHTQFTYKDKKKKIS